VARKSDLVGHVRRTFPAHVRKTRNAGPIVGIATPDFKLVVSGLMVRPPIAAVPLPKYNTVDRPGAFGITEFAGMDPYVMTLPLRFDGYPSTSVEPQMTGLETLAERQPGTLEPPIIVVSGPNVPHSHLRWRITTLAIDDTETMLLKTGERCRIRVDVSFIQHVVDDLLTRSLKSTKRAKGIAAHTTFVRSGEDNLADVSRRVYGTPSRAIDIARASGLRLGARLHVGQYLRYP
jgi:hypothetical protein